MNYVFAVKVKSIFSYLLVLLNSLAHFANKLTFEQTSLFL